MSSKRSPLITADTLKTKNGINRLPGGVITPRESKRRDFSYELPEELGVRFKAWCHLNGRTAKDVLEELLGEFMSDKTLE